MCECECVRVCKVGCVCVCVKRNLCKQEIDEKSFSNSIICVFFFFTPEPPVESKLGTPGS